MSSRRRPRTCAAALPPILLLPAVLPVPREVDGELWAEVLWVDTFGNAQLNVDPADLPDAEAFDVVTGERTRRARRASSYDVLGAGEVGLVVDSYGLVSLAMDRASAAAELGVADGSGGPGVPVTLGRQS